LIFAGGVFPKPMLSVTNDVADAILSRMNVRY